MPKRRYDRMSLGFCSRKLFSCMGLRKRIRGENQDVLALSRESKGHFLAKSGKESFPKRDDSGILRSLSEHDRQPIGICDSPVIQAMFGAL